jgi:hypothetical protein
VQYGLVGPSRLFQSAVYSPLLYGFLLGALAPVLMWLLHKRFPKARFDLWNSTIFFSWYCLYFKFAKDCSPRCNQLTIFFSINQHGQLLWKHLNRSSKLYNWRVSTPYFFFSSRASAALLTTYSPRFVCNFYFFRYRHELWKKYNYLCAAALDAGFNLNMLAIFIFFSAARVIQMPSYFLNDADSIEKCYALQ